MQYLGGKSRIAKFIAAEINGRIGGDVEFWDPFCGGLSVAVALGSRGTISDYSLPLISLYQSVYDGWCPPVSLNEQEYQDARTLPDTNPLKAFAGFGCSFGAKWFGGYARSSKGSDSVQKYALQAAKSLIRDVSILKNRGCVFKHIDFLSVVPEYKDIVIYCDPPYKGTTKYTVVSEFNHELFWERCRQWAILSVPVFVSEYSCPINHNVVWQKNHTSSLKVSNKKDSVTNEYLFRVL